MLFLCREVVNIFKESKEPNMSVYKWQLPVKQSNLTNTDWIHPKAKYHCFDKDGFSLCGKFYQDIYYFETDLEYNYFKSKDECEDFKCEKCKNIFTMLKDNGKLGKNIGGIKYK